MEKFKFNKKAIKVLGIGTVLAGVMFMNSFCFADTEEKLETLHTQDFIEWQQLSDEEKENTLMPKLYTTIIPDSVLESYESQPLNYRMQLLTKKVSKKLYSSLTKAATYNSPSYNLNSNIKVQVKHQGNTNECWAFSTVTMLETNLALTKGTNKTFSPRHMDYATLKTFSDGINAYGFNREAGDGGLAPFGLAYLTNGKGAVLEKDMPFKDDKSKIALKELDKPVDTIVSEYVELPTLYKEFAADGTVTYTNGGIGDNRVEYNSTEVTEVRNILKDHIIKYGAIASVTAGNHAQFYSNPSNPFQAKAYFCNTNIYPRDHAVTIVGWDDTYSKDNFTGAAKPKNNGAYICLNTYGTESFDNGYIYISYEDALIETFLYGIKSTSSVDYSKLYQYNLMGENTAIGLSTRSEGYIAEIFTRDASKTETLQYVGVSVPDDVSLEIYVNPQGNGTSLNSLKKVATTGVLTPGYHRIRITDTRLVGNSFAVVVKEKSNAGRFYFSIEAAVPNSLYSTIKGNPGKNFYSVDGYNWVDLSQESVAGFDMKNTDLCIKAFSNIDEKKPSQQDPAKPDDPEKPADNPTNPSDKDPETPSDPTKITVTSSDYILKQSKTMIDIYKIQPLTTFKTFKSKIKTNSKSIVIYNKYGGELKDSDYLKTGMKMKLSDGSIYKIIVRGDVDGCGDVQLLDFSKFIAHYGYGKEHTLKDDYLKAADMNCDMKIDLTDVSQMVDFYMNK